MPTKEEVQKAYRNLKYRNGYLTIWKMKILRIKFNADTFGVH